MRATDTSDLWWKSAVTYCLDVQTYLDSDGDGVGDLQGLADRIDYLAKLGVNCLWLMPFYPSPHHDDGYDVADFYGVDPRVGTHGELVEVIRTAQDRGIKVIADLLINHTSDQHPWFREARRSKNSRYRDFYVWRDTEPPDTSDQVVFPDEEDSIWTYDERTGEWYLHHFYAHQPDLNVANPAVRDEVMRIAGFWLQLGVDGFRVDAVPFFIEDVETSGDPQGAPADPHDILKELRAFLWRRKGSSMLLGEVNLPFTQQLEYFGGDAGDELTMMFDFVGMQAMYLSLVREDARPMAKALKDRPAIHPSCQWANFLRNHDELTLDKLTESERQEVFDAFGPDPDMQLFDRGLRRRLPPMLDGDPRRIRMAYSLMFSLPGSPSIFYGEEIGMGENLDIPGRLSVRSPMQWDGDRNGGFSTARPSRLTRAVTQDGYAPEHVNVADQQQSPDSLWRFFRELISVRRECHELGWGDFSIIEQDTTAVLAHRCDLEGSSVIAVHNLGADPVTVALTIDGPDDDAVLVDLFEDSRVPLDRGAVTLPLDGYGYHWLRLQPAPQRDRA
ncbi:alpha-amylase family protein [Ornithinimicrobium cryptoxanthini]|uniref:Alpha-amylase family protein n=1 Tax=Ornithinimicrobium cryptoxanthini TaxID=2934161 RepID=A0ABY4YHY7_9MICO|nr:alpha-amylase family protein [Ornithinimicrobium cryptoxanthini]USQ76405.1 alpha-amylase family protein [Ornithinimicrobium cryptoxanthini]